MIKGTSMYLNSQLRVKIIELFNPCILKKIRNGP